ncbi:hypothetical protein [Methylobacterium brachythecii]|nr:hypothetical protein [Methylobacterium brachythecii]MBB3904136.1 hypothetical protein [Methylobacterium brachythecii]
MTAGRASRGNEGGPAVLAVDIDLSRCLDLASGAYWSFVKQAANQYRAPKRQLGPLSIYLDAGISNKVALGRNFEDCDIMNAVVESLKRRMQSLGGDITTVRSAFIEGTPMHETSWLFSNSCIMLSVLEKKAFVSAFEQVM